VVRAVPARDPAAARAAEAARPRRLPDRRSCSRSREDVVKYAQEIGIDYPVLIGEQDGLDAVNKFGQGSIGFPFTVFTDNQGRIVLFHLGEIRKEQADVLFGAVRDVNSGKLTPAAARVVAAKQLAALPAEPSPG